MRRVIKKRYPIDEVHPGMELATSLVTENGKFALGDGTVLTASLINRLKSWNVNFVNIRTTVDIVKTAEKGPVTLSETQLAISENYNATVATIRRSFETMRFLQQVPLKEMQELVVSAIEPFIDTSGILNHLHIVPRKADYTFHHSINVAVLCGIIGRWLGYKGEDFKDLVLAGLLHDVGKTQIPIEILRKPDVLSLMEMEKMKTHTTRGYNLIKDIPGIPNAVLYGVLQHHEREDGSGYPLKVTGDKIHRFAKIVAIADIYDAMTSDTVYKKKKTPFQAVDTIVRDMYDKLDPNICTLFLNNVRDYFIGNVVELSDGREAEVVYQGTSVSDRPIVRTEEGDFIDLERNKGISIVRLVNA